MTTQTRSARSTRTSPARRIASTVIGAALACSPATLALSTITLSTASSDTAYAEEDPPTAQNITPETVVATINGRKITAAEVDKQIEQKPNFAYFLQNAKENPKLLNDLRRRVVHAMINREILLEEAKKSQLVTPAEVEDSVNKVIAGYGGKEKLAELLKAIKTDMPTFETEIRKDFTINTFIEKGLTKDVKVSDEDIKKEFDRDPSKYAQKESVKARHILVKVEPDAPKAAQDAAEKKINQIYKDVTDGKKDFAEVAKAQSECPSAAQGGDLGVFGRGMMVPAFETEAFALKPGAISKPFKTEFGYHIVQTQEHSDAKPGTLESAREQIGEQLLAKKRESVIESKLAELRKGYAVNISI